MNKILVLIICFAFIVSCKNKNKQGSKSIVMGDSSLIVTEKDSQYLQNYVRDISDERDVKNIKQAQNMMAKVDSAQKVHDLQSQDLTNTTINGINANFGNFSVQLGFNAKSKTDSTASNNTLSYTLFDKLYPSDVKIKVTGMQDPKVEQRIFTTLKINTDNSTYELYDLGTYTSSWTTLPGLETVFIAINKSQIQFKNFDAKNLKLAFDRELRKAKLPKKDIDNNLKLIEKTTSYSEVPCEIILVKTEFKITGKIGGKIYTKYIRLYL